MGMITKRITMPKLGESVTEGIITKWFVKVGDRVNKYEPLAEVLTDKVTAEIPASFAGKIVEIIAKEDEPLSVGEVICALEIAGEVEAQKVAGKGEQGDSSQQTTGRYSPAVLNLAAEHQIALESVKGSGMNGRITRKDILLFIEKSVKEPAPKITPAISNNIEIPLTPTRKIIAANMVRSKQEIPHAWMTVEVDVTNLVSYRDNIKDEFKKTEGFPLTYFAFFVKGVAMALKEYPQLNAMWANDRIIQKKEIHLSIAVATDDALYVPVIKNADEKSIKGIAKEIFELATKVRTNVLSASDMEGGTFTVNNTGSFGSVQSAGIINYPQVAILQVESIVKRPVVMNDNMIAIRHMVNVCLSLDHRVLDGLICGRFLGRVKEILEGMAEGSTVIY